MNNRINGSVAEISVLKKLVQQGWDTFIPFTDGTTFDIVIYKPHIGLISVQVKSTTQKAPSGSYIVELKSIRSNRTGSTIHKFDNLKQEILAVYLVELDEVLFFSSKEIQATCSFRISQDCTLEKVDVLVEDLLK